MSVLSGTPPYKLDGISWRKPGILEVEISTFALSEGFRMPAAPEIGDFVSFGVVPRLEAVRVRNQGTATSVVWVFRAGKEMPDSPTDRQGDDRKSQWSMEVSLMQVPITTHPNLKTIMEVGGGVFRDGEVDFPRVLGGAANPYFGTSDFLVPSVTITRQTIEQNSNMSFGQIDKLGYSRKDSVIQSPVGKGGAPIGFGFVSMSKGEGRRPWLLVEHNVRRAGNEQMETKTWRYGGVLGWADPIYDDDFDFKNTSSSGSSGSPLGAA